MSQSDEARNFSLVPRAQEQAWGRLLAMAGALPQGLVLLGPPGVGKKRAVKALFQALNCKAPGRASGGPSDPDEASGSLFGDPQSAPGAETGHTDARASETSSPRDPCGTCVSCRKIAEGRSADLYEIGPRGDSIAVDDLREMKRAINFSPLESRLRFVILDEADRLNASSANTLLKTLEEPPAHTRFFLITHERGLLLPTITSRCQFIHFSALSDEVLESLLEENGYEIPAPLKKTCLALLAGGMARAPLLADEKTLEFLEAATKHLAVHSFGGAEDLKWQEAVKLAETLTPQSDSGEWKTELLLDLVVLLARRDAAASRSCDDTLRFARRALDAAYLRRRLDRNANRKLIGLAAADLATGGQGAAT